MDAGLKLEVHELLSRAAYALDEQDLEMLGACFAPEAEFRMQIAGNPPIPPFVGHAAIMELMRNSMATQTDKRRHVVSNIFFAAEGDTEVRVVSNLTLFGTENGVIRLISTALYRDRAVRRDGRWLLAERSIELDLPY
jgi:3-phenylpropionate/cinnamic acid dioxygenase small subunit